MSPLTTVIVMTVWLYLAVSWRAAWLGVGLLVGLLVGVLAVLLAGSPIGGLAMLS
ncbi:MAG: hypothetical protein IPP57_16280 [Candidatus Obscuribacter sp.]|nr:hypothetical protein [Candidatus Obscuribacter sp.]